MIRNFFQLFVSSENDLTVAKEQNWFDVLIDVELFADNAYSDKEYFEPRKQ
jgi:hypothetical protein